MKFSKEFLLELKWQDGVSIIEDDIVGHSRWTVEHTCIFKYEDKFFRTNYSVGATESQYSEPYEYEDNEIECEEVFPKEVRKTIYVTKKDLDNV